MKFRTLAERALLSASVSALAATSVFAADVADRREEILVTAARETSEAGTKTNTPLLETPQPISIIKDDVFLAQGALSVSDTLRYSAGVAANPYGQDSRVDGGLIRGINAAQFRDGMQDIFSYYASIRSDPYNFSQVEVVRGPASVLFGSGSIGGLVNLVSKTPSFDNAGEVSLRYGSHDRMEALGDFTGAITDNIAGRLVMRVRDSDTQTDNVQDDRIMLAPSMTWRLDDDTNLKLIGLYQKDKSGSTAQFLPLVGTMLRTTSTGLPAAALVLVATGLGPQLPAVPLSALHPLALPGCNLHVVPTGVGWVLASQGIATTALPIPNSAAFAGVQLFQQMAPVEFDAGGSIVAITSTNALQLTVGVF